MTEQAKQQATGSEDIVFTIAGKNVFRLTREGFIYNNTIIQDAGDAYLLFKTWLEKTKEVEEDGSGSTD